MSLSAIGDLALGFQNRLANLRLKREIQALAGELTTGKLRDVSQALGRDLGALAGIEAGISTLEAYQVSASEAALIGSAAQAALATLESSGNHAGTALVQAGTHGEATQLHAAAVDTLAKFETVLAALNTRVADRSIFAGVATSGPAVADADTMLDALEAEIASETTAEGVAARVDAWFDATGGGYGSLGYLGADTPLAPMRVGSGVDARFEITAGDAEIRRLLKGYAMAGLLARGALSGRHEERAALAREAGERILTGAGELAALSAAVGRAEARIEEAKAANGAEITALQLARSELVSADPYATASALEQVRGQIEALYAMTGRMSRLTLVEYLR
ncbi:flagellar hook-associated protein 3 FlgL [Meinhardsimonia xiamenensis]|jgi:flagellar hook-associated protein 3 FlgL|uniref:Flagellar hook-associated protein 3 FlgL n=1 Tax=Meinhardsimonia xiamenensis TaxID=990712 RepID=A0A1G9EFI3_9RHOB|nr:flagellin [Meinhardsimonia xiamenensis]PRX33793.1 flagellar hook-associated protein 3 FlgL [Meinhardsimonia xiamenensis]SDK74823.1 flagellar hook-associated protein 3 FlgL [Meinhardsimonia xiamenensis]